MMQFNKKINKAGSLTIPSALRRELGIEPGARFKVDSKEDGSIVLTRTQGECIFCKSDVGLTVHMGRCVCKKCIEILNERGKNDECR